MIEGQNGRSFALAPLREHLERCLGKTLGELDVSHEFRSVANVKKRTGIAGDVVEYSILLLPKKGHSEPEPDIKIDGIGHEVKTTGLKRDKASSGLEAKEPVTITAVSPEKIVGEEYRSSTFWHKVEHLLFLYYFYDYSKAVEPGKPVSPSGYAEFPLLEYQFHEYGDFSEEEQRTLENDWRIVRDFVAFLQAKYLNYKREYPRISYELRSRLMLLDTAPKWPRNPRFRFKKSFVTTIYLRHVGDTKKQKEVLKRAHGGYERVQDIVDECTSIVRRYKGKTVGWLCKRYGITASKGLKSIAEPIIVGMFGGTRKKMNDIDLFSKVGIVGKNIVLTKNGGRTEDTKFFTIDFAEIAEKDLKFEDSQFYEYFSTHKVLFAIFEEPSQKAPLRENKFLGFSLISWDENFIQQNVGPVWKRVRHLVLDKKLVDVPICYTSGLRKGEQRVNKNGELSSVPNFPKSSEGLVFVRGTGSDSKDKREVVNGIRMYSQQVWIKGSYLSDLVAHSPQIM